MKLPARRCAAIAAGTLLALGAMTGPAMAASANSANNDGPYTGVGVGDPSLNGNGNGNAVGRPTAGEVGKADAKNPKGQLPGPDDANNGYECDGNNGIAKGNPAHTGCTTGPQ